MQTEITIPVYVPVHHPGVRHELQPGRFGSPGFHWELYSCAKRIDRQFRGQWEAYRGCGNSDNQPLRKGVFPRQVNGRMYLSFRDWTDRRIAEMTHIY